VLVEPKVGKLSATLQIANAFTRRRRSSIWLGGWGRGEEGSKRRLKQAGLPAHYSSHLFRATGITNFFENDGTLEAAQRIAGHADSRTTKLYDRPGQKVLLEDMEDSVRTRTTRSGIFASHGNLWNPVSSTVFQQSKTNETKTRFATPRQKE
jgi:hypothetical protein